MNKIFYFAVINLLFNLTFSKAQTVALSNNNLGQSAVYTFNYITAGAIGTGTTVTNVFYFSLPVGYPQVSPIVSGGSNLQPYVTFKVNGVTYPCTAAFGGIGGSWNSGIQLSVSGATTGVVIPAGAQIQVAISGLIKNPSNAGAYTINWKTARASGDTVQEFNFPVNFSATLATLESNPHNKELSVYPNPANDVIQVSGLAKTEKYTVYNVSGNQIIEGNISENGKIDIHHLVNGVYFLKVENGKSVKFIKN